MCLHYSVGPGLALVWPPERPFCHPLTRAAQVPTAVQITSSRRRSERLRPSVDGKASGFPANPAPFLLLRTVRRLTDCAEEVVEAKRPSERPSLFANQAAKPQLVASANNLNLHKPGEALPLRLLGDGLPSP
jgi:hypothetical protein